MRCIVTALWCLIVLSPTPPQSEPKPYNLTNPPDANPQYFPNGAFGDNPKYSEWAARWYASELRALEEPSLYENESPADSKSTKDLNAEIYRITILPTWGNAVCIRVHRNGELFDLSARRLDGQAGYDPGKLVESKNVTLSTQDSKTLAMLIQNMNFFHMPAEDDVRGFDGDEWIIEGVSKGNYHVAERWCAEAYNPRKRNLTALLDLCKFLMNKSRLSERPSNKGHKLI
jgi:hypothetical protein